VKWSHLSTTGAISHPAYNGYAGAVETLAKRRLVIVSGRCHPTLAMDIADKLGVSLTEANVREFANGEIHCRFDESIRGAHVFIIQTHSSPVNDAVMEQLIMIDAAKRASAKSITAVIPNYGYARQDRKSAGREPITAKLIADMLQTAGASRVLSVDFHSGQIQGFFDIPVDHLVAAPVLEEYLKSNVKDTHRLVVVAPDAGRVKVAERYAQHLGCDLALVHKTRPPRSANVAEARHIVGDVEGRHCVLIDDMIDTAGTIVAACDLLKAHGAEEIWVMATHAVFSPPAVDRLFNAPVSRVIVTDTLPLGPERRFEKLEILSVATIIANAISAIFEDSSVSDIFGGENLL
jgi:ribose-phosphate pyrophosphokinase